MQYKSEDYGIVQFSMGDVNSAVQYGPCEYTMLFLLSFFEIHFIVAFLCVPLSLMDTFF